MSFFGGSECATGANPLAQVNKHSQMDTSVQNSIRNGQQKHQQQPNQLQSNMSIQDRQQYDAFMANKTGASNFNFSPMAREINTISADARVGMPNTNSWSSEFMHSNSSVNMQQQQQQQQQNQQQAQNQNQQQSIYQQHPTQQIQQGFNPLMMGAPMMQMSNQHMMHMMQSRNTYQQQHNQPHPATTTHESVQEPVQNWEDQFKEIETQIVNATDSQLDASAAAVDEMNSAFEASEDYLKLFTNRPHDQYAFEEKNDFMHNPNAYEIGCRLMEGGAKLSEAAMAFEAAVQEYPKHVEAWLKLGQCQIQNEKELQGVTALENCLHNDPSNLTALMNLAISYVNEGYDTAAFKSFEKWIETKYPDVVAKARTENPDSTADDRYTLNKRVTNLFIRAAQLSPSGANVDADVQTGLGVLFYSMEEYDKTLDCFQAAIRCDPNDALSWNRLGASYANSNRPEQAIESYSKALQLNPNFVRARYNLGVSFINMGMYRDAVDQLLTGLSMHEVEDPDGDGSFVSDTEQSGSLIETLKRALLAMDKRDIIDKVKPGMNVSEFRTQYGF